MSLTKMREIKFRAWNTVIKKMQFVKGLRWVDTEKLNHIILGEIDAYTYPGILILLQFTGLKDKNGIEIYEGDIVGYWGDACWEILFQNGSFRYGNYITNFSARELTKKKVIGNIYENPELLTKKGGEK